MILPYWWPAAYNHLFYADDMSFICWYLLTTGVQQLLNVCQYVSILHSLLCNVIETIKSYTLCFKLISIKFDIPYFYLGELIINLFHESAIVVFLFFWGGGRAGT